MAKAHKTAQKIEHEHKVEHHGHCLEPKRLGFAFGILKSLGFGLLALLATTLGWGSALVRMLGSVFLGYEASLLGVFFGLIWGFACGFIAGYVFALIYNKAEKCSCC
jgi:hypothetical protein